MRERRRGTLVTKATGLQHFLTLDMSTWLSRTLGGHVTDTDDDINEAMPFPRAERHQPSGSLISSDNLGTYKGLGDSVEYRRTWDPGQWAGGRPKSGRKRSILANTLMIVLIVASLPLILGYIKYGGSLATFGDHSSMLPWLSGHSAVGTQTPKAPPETRLKANEITRADEQEPWHPTHAKARKAVLDVQNAEHALAHDAQGESSSPGASAHSTLSALAKTLLDTTASARAALGGSPQSVEHGDKPSEALLLKYRAAEREVHSLEGKVSFLERKVVQDRVHEQDSQASALVKAEAEIARLQKTLTSLEAEAEGRGRRHHEERRRIAALEQENLRLERAVVDKRQEKDEISKLTARVSQLSRDEGQRLHAANNGELAALHRKLGQHLAAEEARVKALTDNKVRLAAQLEAAKHELQSLRARAAPSKPAAPAPAAPASNAFSPPPVPSSADSSGRRSAVDKLVKAASSPASPSPRSAPSSGSSRPTPDGRRGHRGGRARGASGDAQGKYRGLDYEDEVQAKENDEEKRIAKQARRMLSRRAEQVGLDARHRRMLRHLERQKTQRDLKADAAADRDLAAREAEINSMLGSASKCPGPGCMQARGDPAVRQATSYASRRFAPQSY